MTFKNYHKEDFVTKRSRYIHIDTTYIVGISCTHTLEKVLLPQVGAKS